MHTPGPWSIDLPFGEPGTYIQSPDTALVCRVLGEDKALRFANAHLIAAAPEMLAAMEQLQRWFSNHGPALGESDATHDERMIRMSLNAAIAKAKGEPCQP